MEDARALAETAVASDLFGAEGLTEDTAPPAPGKYAIQGLLGRGGGGAVYLARDTHLGRPVALKFLSHSRPAEVERFFREARFAARLNNPSIVQVYEAGEVEGWPYIAMQYIAGGNLATVDLGVAETVRVMHHVASALAHAHTQGIVHRDIKPENILLDEERRAYLTDFGIARDLHGELGATISRDGQILGTPALMSPEQARGETDRVDAGSDIYSLGATLYLKLTGRPPFDSDNLVDVLHAVIHDEPPFPRRHRSDLPRDLEAIILRCMRKRREDRYASMDEVIQAFDRHLRGEGTAALSPAWFTTLVRQRVEEAPPPKADVVTTERDWLPALEVAQEIAEWDTHLYRVTGDLTRHYPRLDNMIARLDGVLEQEPASGWARFYRGVCWFRRGELRRALDDMERSIDRVRDLAGAYFELGRLYLAIYLDEHHAAHQHLSRVGVEDRLRHARSGLAQASIAFQEARRLKRDLPDWQTRYAEAVYRLAEDNLAACIATCDAILADDPDREEVWKLKGDALARLGSDPLPAYTKATEIRRSYYEALVAMGEAHLAAGRTEEARGSLGRALEIHNGLVSAGVLLARTYLVEAQRTGSSDAVAEGLEKAIPIWEDNPHRQDAAVTLAELQLMRGRVSGATEAFTQALATLDRAERLEGCSNRVSYLQAQARLERARRAVATGMGEALARTDLEAILALRDRHEPHVHVPDNAPWLDLFSQAERTLEDLPDPRV